MMISVFIFIVRMMKHFDMHVNKEGHFHVAQWLYYSLLDINIHIVLRMSIVSDMHVVEVIYWSSNGYIV
jgi:hypothetical protein